MMYGLGRIIDMSKGQEAYDYRNRYRCSWSEVAKEIGYCNSQSALRAARTYAAKKGHPWPLTKASKGACIYQARRHGVTWMALSRTYNQDIAAVQRCAYKWARRYNKQWPPR
jgi:hypothetical protein